MRAVAFRAVYWQPAGLISATSIGPILGLYIGNLQGLSGLLGRF